MHYLQNKRQYIPIFTTIQTSFTNGHEEVTGGREIQWQQEALDAKVNKKWLILCLSRVCLGGGEGWRELIPANYEQDSGTNSLNAIWGSENHILRQTNRLSELRLELLVSQSSFGESREAMPPCCFSHSIEKVLLPAYKLLKINTVSSKVCNAQRRRAICSPLNHHRWSGFSQGRSRHTDTQNMNGAVYPMQTELAEG